MSITKKLFAGFKYLIFQGAIEILLIITMEYLGINTLADFSKSNLLIENIEGVAWAIAMKTIIFSLLYLPLFLIIISLLSGKKTINASTLSIVNAILSVFLLLVLFLIKRLELSEMLFPLVATLIAALIIIVLNMKVKK
ncbi:hypothetical protein [Chitinophaga silvisoli]|uniref:Uncharacterized protein n=1 Tax=Chitinophaga silvisoli TaxID=2291814 RepID=A0A3E1NWR2_9BACT|nr:hypothetical protein [Chitinophaga silvisoli]RFM32359.1 hypothetical protein DXN04_21975 [Chitinophaga silvisoli]